MQTNSVVESVSSGSVKIFPVYNKIDSDYRLIIKDDSIVAGNYTITIPGLVMAALNAANAIPLSSSGTPIKYFINLLNLTLPIVKSFDRNIAPELYKYYGSPNSKGFTSLILSPIVNPDFIVNSIKTIYSMYIEIRKIQNDSIVQPNKALNAVSTCVKLLTHIRSQYLHLEFIKSTYGLK